MTMATTMAGERVDSDEDNNKDPNSEDNNDLIFDTTTNLWLDAFLAGRGVILTMMTTAKMTTKMRGDFDKDDHGNNNHKDDDNDNTRTFHLCREGGCQLG